MKGADEGSNMVITHKIPVASPNSSTTLPSISEQRTILRQLRHQLLLHYRPVIQQGAGPIRVMARIVADLQGQCHELNINEEIMQTEIVNRTIGDVNVRLITELSLIHISEPTRLGMISYAV